MKVEFGKESRPARYGADGNVRLINGYCERVSKEGLIQLPIYSTPGFTEIIEVGEGPIAGMFVVGTFLYVVSGEFLYRIVETVEDGVSTFTATQLGSMPGAGRVYFAQNRKQPTNQVVAVRDGVVYVIVGDSVTLLNDADLPAPASVEFFAGYFFFPIEDSKGGRYYWTAIDNTTVSSLDFATAEASHDPLLHMVRRGNEVWAFGTLSIEVLGPNTRGASPPLVRQPGAYIEQGALNAATIQKISDSMFWVDQNWIVRRADQYKGAKISHSAVDKAISLEPDKASMSAIAVTSRGHQFYVLHGTSFTWAYDLTTELWFEWQSYNLARWRIGSVVTFGERTFVGDAYNGTIYELSADVYSENGQPIVTTVRGEIHTHPHSIQLSRVSALLIPATGAIAGGTEVTAPEVMLRLSGDNGATWPVERRREVGRVGQHNREVVFGKLGMFDERGVLIELSMSAAVARGFLSLDVGGQTLRRRP